MLLQRGGYYGKPPSKRPVLKTQTLRNALSRREVEAKRIEEVVDAEQADPTQHTLRQILRMFNLPMRPVHHVVAPRTLNPPQEIPQEERIDQILQDETLRGRMLHALAQHDWGRLRDLILMVQEPIPEPPQLPPQRSRQPVVSITEEQLEERRGRLRSAKPPAVLPDPIVISDVNPFQLECPVCHKVFTNRTKLALAMDKYRRHYREVHLGIKRQR